MGEISLDSLKIHTLKQEGKIGDFWIELKSRLGNNDNVSGSVRCKIVEN